VIKRSGFGSVVSDTAMVTIQFKVFQTFCALEESYVSSGRQYSAASLRGLAAQGLNTKESAMGTILIIILILLLIGGLPVFPHSRSWGYGPSGIIGTVLVILLILVLLGKI
jgi:hypothetical protein